MSITSIEQLIVEYYESKFHPYKIQVVQELGRKLPFKISMFDPKNMYMWMFAISLNIVFKN